MNRAAPLVYNEHMSDRPLITSTSNPLVKRFRALRKRKARVKNGLFLVEGLQHVGSALEAGWEVERLLFAPDLLSGDFSESLLDNARRIGLAPQPVSAKVMDSLAAKENPQGIIASIRQKITQLDALQNFHCGVALVSPQDPGNVGAVLRTIDAVGGDALFLLEGGVDPFHPTSVRASMGTIFWKPIVKTGFAELVQWVKAGEYQLIGSSAHSANRYQELTLRDVPWILLLGNEQKGLSSGELGACDDTVSLPMRGRVSSLNLAVAAGILLYAIWNQSKD